jgi:hypothetical protein
METGQQQKERLHKFACKVNPLMEAMLADLLTKQPRQPIPEMIKFLEEHQATESQKKASQ